MKDKRRNWKFWLIVVLSFFTFAYSAIWFGFMAFAASNNYLFFMSEVDVIMKVNFTPLLIVFFNLCIFYAAYLMLLFRRRDA